MAEEVLDLKTRFEAAMADSKTLPVRPDNSMLLKLYGLFKQATEGDNRGERPGSFDFVAGAKFDAWHKLIGTTREEAMRGYVFLVEGLKD